MDDELKDTRNSQYAERLQAKAQTPWKRLLPVQAPYRWNLRRQHLGRTLDVGCGIGRNLEILPMGSIGVDHNEEAVKVARTRGLTAYTVDEWQTMEAAFAETFDSLLIAHVIEHMARASAQKLLDQYLPFLRRGGKVFLICPQERGFASDPTHVQFTTDEDLTVLATRAGLKPIAKFSFPFPHSMGRLFTYNEFCVLAVK